MDIERTIRQLKNDKKRVEKNINLNKKRFIEEIKSGLGAEIKKGISTTLKKTSKLMDEIDEIKGTKKEYKAKGGRVGLKFGTSRKSNLQKIQETFGPKQTKKKEKPKERMMAKKGSKPKKKFPDLTGDGKVTFADVLKGRGVINGKKKPKKKVI